MLLQEILYKLKTKRIGKRIYYFDKIGSTQCFALKIANNKIENGTIVITRHQTDGRGRMNRKWQSTEGNMCLSIILHPKLCISNIKFFPFVTSLALSITIEKYMKLQPKLKWPNDVMVDGKKVAGILTDVSIESDKIKYIIIGIGINFNINTNYIKNTFNSTNFCDVTTLIKYKSICTQTKFIQNFIFELETLLIRLEKNETAGIIKNWLNRSYI